MRHVRLYGRELTVYGNDEDETYRHLPSDVDIAEPVLAALASQVGSDSVCVDVGAGFGLHTMALSVLAPNGKVVSIEPSPGAFADLERNITENGLANVTAQRVWPAGSEGGAPFLDPAVARAASTRGTGDGSAPAGTVDQLVEELHLPRVDVLRISLDGAELGVLRGAGRTLHEHRPAVFVVFNSFALAIRQGMLPHVALGRLRDMFPYCHVLDRANGAPAALSTDAECSWFLYDNSSQVPVDHLLCTFDSLPAPGYSHRSFVASVGEMTTVVSQRDAARREAEVLRERHAELARDHETVVAEVEALRRTLSWRVTAPLRAVRSRAAGR